MQFYELAIDRFNKALTQLKCTLLFLIISGIYLVTVFFFIKDSWAFYPALFVLGWFTWTFTEYILHRFWMHHKDGGNHKQMSSTHHHHHTHPTDISVTPLQRFLLVLISTVLILVSILVFDYLLILAGFFLGFAGYTCIHWLLHQKWSAYLFPRLHKFHIYHHCKYPETCFGVSVCWWDILFKTTPPSEAVLSKRIVEFYYTGKKDLTAKTP